MKRKDACYRKAGWWALAITALMLWFLSWVIMFFVSISFGFIWLLSTGYLIYSVFVVDLIRFYFYEEEWWIAHYPDLMKSAYQRREQWLKDQGHLARWESENTPVWNFFGEEYVPE